MGGGSRPARDRRRDECPAAVCELEVTGPLQTLGKRRSRQRRGGAGSRARAVKVERGCTSAGIFGKKIKIQTHGHGRACEDILDHDAGLKHALGKADEIATPILDGVVRQACSVHRQHDKKAVAVASDPAKNKTWTGGRPVFVPRAFERALPSASIVQVDTIEGRIRNPYRGVKNREVFARLLGRRQASVRSDRFDTVAGKTVASRLELVRRTLVSCHPRNTRCSENGGLVAEKAVGETLEFSATDAVLGRLESRTQCRNVVYVFVDPVLQDQKMVTGAASNSSCASRFSR
jgi:hypothetical protein